MSERAEKIKEKVIALEHEVSALTEALEEAENAEMSMWNAMDLADINMGEKPHGWIDDCLIELAAQIEERLRTVEAELDKYE